MAQAFQTTLAAVAAQDPQGARGREVVLLADRGLSGSTLARLALECGWHYLLRVTRRTRVRIADGTADGTIQEIGALVPVAGTSACWSQAQLYPPRRKRHTPRVDATRSAGARAGGSGLTQWDAALSAQVVAVWRARDQEAWLLVTDLPASMARCTEYRRRTWQEELFRDLKGLGWHWDQSRVLRPERVERLLLALALATLWMLGLGQRVLRRGRRRLLEERARRCYSLFQLGLRWRRRCDATNQRLQVTFDLYPISHAPCPKLS